MLYIYNLCYYVLYTSLQKPSQGHAYFIKNHHQVGKPVSISLTKAKHEIEK